VAHKEIFHGILVPLVTPLNEHYEIDFAALERILNHVIKGGVHGVFILGTTGEATTLPFEHRKSLIEETNKIIAKRIPFWVGISDTVVQNSLQLATHAAKHGAAAVVAAPPYYRPLQQEELKNYYWKLADRVSVPLYLYNFPALTKIEIATETVFKLAEHPNIWGLKDSSGDLPYLKKLLNKSLDSPFTWLVGPEALLLKSLALGAHGGVNGGANLFPELFVEAYNAFQKKDQDRCDASYNLIQQVGKEIYREGYPNGSFLKGLKSALAAAHWCDNILMPPFERYDEALQNEIAKQAAIIKEQLEKHL